ncbi:MAG: DUF3500 domain-containing protein [Hyphomicrobiaceae bacterium]
MSNDPHAQNKHHHPLEQTSGLSRREALQLTLPVAAAGLLGPGMFPARAGLAKVGTLMLDRSRRFLKLLNKPQHNKATFAFASKRRKTWSFMWGSRYAPGLPLEKMRKEQQEAALDLLAAALSSDGMTKAGQIMLQQDILRDEWQKGSPDRNRERFSLMIFGTPSETGRWGWRFEGHHLSLSFTLKGTDVVSITPSSFSSEPNTVPSGPHKGLIVLKDEETIGRRLFADLSAKNRKAALLRRASYGNILATAGRESRVLKGHRAGVPLADLPQAQVDLILRLMDVYAVDNFAGPLAGEQRKRLREGDMMSTRFGWAGPNTGEKSMYYRLHGDTFLIEFATLRNQPLHHHTIRHDAERNFGVHRI